MYERWQVVDNHKLPARESVVHLQWHIHNAHWNGGDQCSSIRCRRRRWRRVWRLCWRRRRLRGLRHVRLEQCVRRECSGRGGRQRRQWRLKLLSLWYECYLREILVTCASSFDLRSVYRRLYTRRKFLIRIFSTSVWRSKWDNRYKCRPKWWMWFW